MKPSSRYPLVYAIAALLLWLIPFFWTGWTKRSMPVFPRILSFQHSAAGLFTHRSTQWWDHHLEVQRADDARYELDERSVFPMGAFGYRTRYDRILNESDRSRASRQIRQRIAEYVAARALRIPDSAEATPITGQAKALRLVRTSWAVGSPGLAYPAGSWAPPPVTEVAPANRFLLGTYRLSPGRVIEVLRRPSIPSSGRAVTPSPPPARSPTASQGPRR